MTEHCVGSDSDSRVGVLTGGGYTDSVYATPRMVQGRTMKGGDNANNKNCV